MVTTKEQVERMVLFVGDWLGIDRSLYVSDSKVEVGEVFTRICQWFPDASERIEKIKVAPIGKRL